MLTQDIINLETIKDYLNKIVNLLIEELEPFKNKICQNHHNHANLYLTKKLERSCFEMMIKNYIYSITINKSKEFLYNSENCNNINFNDNDLEKVKNFVNNYENYSEGNFEYFQSKCFSDHFPIKDSQNISKKNKVIFLCKKMQRD